MDSTLLVGRDWHPNFPSVGKQYWTLSLFGVIAGTHARWHCAFLAVGRDKGKVGESR